MDGMSRLVRRCLLSGAALAAVALPATAVLPQVASAASEANSALINADSVTTSDGITNGSGEPISLEQFAAENAGFHVTLASGAEWEAMTPEQFAHYQVLIVGDPKCGGVSKSANASSGVWAPVVMGTAGTGTSVGNRAVVGTDPEYHYLIGNGTGEPGHGKPLVEGQPATAGAEHLVQDGIAFAGAVPGATGAYYDTSCGGSGNEIVETLGKLSVGAGGKWEEGEEPPCEAPVAQIATNSVFNTGPTKLTDEDISGWECSSHVSFVSYPADWTALAITLALEGESRPTPVCGSDIETGVPRCGQAYVLVAGRGISAKAPNLSLEPEAGSDLAGGDHTVTANVHKEGKPIAGSAVSFVVTETNNGVAGTCTTTSGAPDPECKTDEAGNVRFTYHDVNGVGNDTIIASVTIESEFTEGETARKVLTTESATATEAWTPPPPPPAPTTSVLAAKVVSTGSAHLSRAPACVASTGYVASVRGKGIASVTYALDGHKLATVKHAKHGAFSLRVHMTSGRAHHLSIRVSFTASSHTKPLTIKRTLARCAAVKRAAPRFTG